MRGRAFRRLALLEVGLLGRTYASGEPRSDLSPSVDPEDECRDQLVWGV